MVMARKSIGDYLVEKGYASAQEVEDAKKAQQSTKGDLAKILVDLGLNPTHVYEAKAAELGQPFVDLTVYKPDPSALNVVPEHVAKRHNVLPVKKDGSILYVAMADTNNIQAADDLRLVSRCTVKGVLAVPDHITDAIARLYGGSTADAPSAIKGGMNPGKEMLIGGTMEGDMKEIAAIYSAKNDKDITDEETGTGVDGSDDAPIVRLANTIIQQAIKERASDIHIEPGARNMRVRYRIDGVLHEAMPMPKYLQMPLTARYKILSEMNIAERRVPQDGRIPIRYENKDYDLRVSCLPNLFGEKIVMRILDKSSIMIGLNKLGFTPEMQAQLEDLSNQPNGMLITTGPTGSGKTTTQYSLLNRLNTVGVNILTVEDPCEYQLNGITQVQVNKKAGLDFGKALRSFLRQDPDIIMVGEMRDLETAEIAIESALTGHLVLSTLHTNDAPSATIRLIDMGIEPFLISATMIGIMAQRLGRKICSNCKETYEVQAIDLKRFGYQVEDPGEMITLARGRGCEICRHTGYKGRIGFYELMRMNAEMAEMIVRRAPLGDLKAAAKANGMK